MGVGGIEQGFCEVNVHIICTLYGCNNVDSYYNYNKGR